MSSHYHTVDIVLINVYFKQIYQGSRGITKTATSSASTIMPVFLPVQLHFPKNGWEINTL